MQREEFYIRDLRQPNSCILFEKKHYFWELQIGGIFIQLRQILNLNADMQRDGNHWYTNKSNIMFINVGGRILTRKVFDILSTSNPSLVNILTSNLTMTHLGAQTNPGKHTCKQDPRESVPAHHGDVAPRQNPELHQLCGHSPSQFGGVEKNRAELRGLKLASNKRWDGAERDCGESNRIL